MSALSRMDKCGQSNFRLLWNPKSPQPASERKPALEKSTSGFRGLIEYPLPVFARIVDGDHVGCRDLWRDEIPGPATQSGLWCVVGERENDMDKVAAVTPADGLRCSGVTAASERFEVEADVSPPAD